MGDLKVLSYGIGQDGFYRVAVELPGGHTKQTVTVKGTDVGAPFESSADIIVCSSIHSEAEPKIITFSNGEFNQETIQVKFSTYDFTPTAIYADLGSVKGTRCQRTFLIADNEITEYELVRQGDQTTFFFEFPQGWVTEADGSQRKRKLSDILDPSQMYSMSQPLTIGLLVKGDTFEVSNFEQLSSRNLITNFSTPVKFINLDAYSFDIISMSGVEDNPGMVSLDLKIKKTGGLAFGNSQDLTPSVSVRPSGSKYTLLNFSGGKYNTDSSVDPSSFIVREGYQANTQFDLLNQGTVYIRGRSDNPGDTREYYYPVNQSNSNNNFISTYVTVEKDISDTILGYDKRYRDVLLADFLPTAMRVHSDREDISEEIALKVEEYTIEGNTVKEITLTPETPVYGSLMDNGNIQLELIDSKISGLSFFKEIEVDRSIVPVTITTDLFGAYNVDIGFFKDANIDDTNSITELFWNPIKIANDGTLGIPGKALKTDPKIYVRLESTRSINEVTGRILIGNDENQTHNRFTFNTNMSGQGKISTLYSNVAYLKIDLSNVVTPEERINLKINVNLSIIDKDGNVFSLSR